MAPDLTSLTPEQALGIPVALVGSLFLALGAQFQHRAVNKVDGVTGVESGHGGLDVRQVLQMLRRPSWLIGTLLMTLAIIFQLISLVLAPLTVVQPLGVLGLVITSIVNARVSKVPLDRASIRSIAICVVGVGIFVTVAAFNTSSVAPGRQQLIIILIILAIVLALIVTAFLLFRKKFTAIFYIIGAGITFGFVATLAKTVIDFVTAFITQHRHLQPSDILVIICLLGLIVAGLVGSYFVQTAYSTGPPDLAVAGLTVIDPMVGVTIGIVVLGEAHAAAWWAGIVFVISGAIAVYGVFQLSKYHPQIRR